MPTIRAFTAAERHRHSHAVVRKDQYGLERGGKGGFARCRRPKPQVAVLRRTNVNVFGRRHEAAKHLKPILEKIYGFPMPFSPQQVSQVLRHLGVLDDNVHSIWEKKLRRRYITRAGIQAIENFVKATPLEALRSFGSKAVISMAEMLA